MTIDSPSYSFVKFDSPEAVNSCCDGDQEFCIPVIEETDTYFQVKVTSDVYSEIQDMMDDDSEDAAAAFHLLLLSGSGNTPENFADNILRDWTYQDDLTFEKYRTGLFEITLQWRSQFKDIKTLLGCGDCFQIALIRTGEFSGEFSDEFTDEFTIDGSEVAYDFVAISNCFKRFCDDCFTSVLEYYNDEDYADFNYCNMVNPVNRVRLPFYLSQPKTIEDKAVYRKSNGGIIQTRSLITKEYLAQTDHVPEVTHDKITIALAHDFTNVISGSYTGGISKNGEYVIEWTDNICTAPANFKATASPFVVRNNNCQDCEEVAECVEIVVPDFSLPDGNVGDAYSFSVAITGLSPVISDLTGPSWLSVTYTAPNLLFTGTPDAEGTELLVSFVLSNVCTDPITIYKTLNIDIMFTGFMLPWTGDPLTPPAGYFICDHSAKSRITYANLFAVCGTRHGAGDGTTTFNIPGPGGKTIAGYIDGDSEYGVSGTTVGLNEITLIPGQMPKHRVKIFKEAGDSASLNAAWPAAPRAISRRNPSESGNSEYRFDPAPAGEADTGDSSEVGNDEPIDIRSLSLVLPWIIKY